MQVHSIPAFVPRHPFPQTRWTMVLSAKGGETDASFEALEQLAMSYWKPVYAFLRGKGRPHDEAQDYTQGFFAYLLGRDFLKNIQPEGGRFRNFLPVALRRWMKDERNRVINVKRDAEIELQPWHGMEAMENGSHSAGASPEEAFDRSWAVALISRSMNEVQDRWENRAELFDALRLTVENPGDVENYSAVAERLGITEGAVANAASELRKQFAERFRQQVRDTVARDEDVEGEMRYLVQLLQK